MRCRKCGREIGPLEVANQESDLGTEFATCQNCANEAALEFAKMGWSHWLDRFRMNAHEVNHPPNSNSLPAGTTEAIWAFCTRCAQNEMSKGYSAMDDGIHNVKVLALFQTDAPEGIACHFCRKGHGKLLAAVRVAPDR
jgi:hypothetical protein